MLSVSRLMARKKARRGRNRQNRDVKDHPTDYCQPSPEVPLLRYNVETNRVSRSSKKFRSVRKALPVCLSH
jgi:hypothetical protein